MTITSTKARKMRAGSLEALWNVAKIVSEMMPINLSILVDFKRQ